MNLSSCIQPMFLRNSKHLTRNILNPSLGVRLAAFLSFLLLIQSNRSLSSPEPSTVRVDLWSVSTYGLMGIDTRPSQPHPGNSQSPLFSRGDPIRHFRISWCELKSPRTVNENKSGQKVFQDQSSTCKISCHWLISVVIEFALQLNRMPRNHRITHKVSQF